MSSKKKRGGKPVPTGKWLAGQTIDLFRRFGNSLIWAAVTCFLIWQTKQAVQSFAGRTSIASLIFEVAAKLNATVTASVALSGVSLGLWVNECRMHRRTRKRLAERTAALELRLDPNRESSQLTPEGTTRKGDQ